MLEAEVVHDPIDLPEVDVPDVGVVLQVAVVVEVRGRIGPKPVPPVVNHRLAPVAVVRARIQGVGFPEVAVPEISVRLLPRWGVQEARLRPSRNEAVLPSAAAAMHAEWRNIAYVAFEIELVPHVVHHDIDEDVHAELVRGTRQVPELLHGSQPPIEHGEVTLGVLLIAIGTVLKDGRYPDRLAAEALDVGQPLREAGEVAAVPEGHVPDVEAFRVGLIVSGLTVCEAISDQLVN